jgi:hypothetical protein
MDTPYHFSASYLITHSYVRFTMQALDMHRVNIKKFKEHTFVTQNALERNPAIFTAKDIIDHIVANCTCDNSNQGSHTNQK